MVILVDDADGVGEYQAFLFGHGGAGGEDECVAFWDFDNHVARNKADSSGFDGCCRSCDDIERDGAGGLVRGEGESYVDTLDGDVHTERVGGCTHAVDWFT